MNDQGKDQNMMNTFELCFVAISCITVAILFIYCSSNNSIISLKEEKTAIKRKKRRGDRKKTNTASSSENTESSGEEEAEEDLNKNKKIVVTRAGAEAKVERLEAELAEVKMKNLKLIKIQETMELKFNSLTEEIKMFKVVQTAAEKTECELLVANNRVEQLETELISIKEVAEADREDNKRLHKMLLEQQSVIRTAMVRIFPKKESNQMSFCEEHLKAIKTYEEGNVVHRH